MIPLPRLEVGDFASVLVLQLESVSPICVAASFGFSFEELHAGCGCGYGAFPRGCRCKA